MFRERSKLMLREAWDYDRRKWTDKKGQRWHFALHVEWDGEAEQWCNERVASRTFTLFFRDDARTIFGVVPHSVSKGYWDEKLKQKLMTNEEFRITFINPATKRIWKKNWK